MSQNRLSGIRQSLYQKKLLLGQDHRFPHLKSQVQKLGYTVAHIKTDSIKIPNATQEIQDFVIKFGKEFGYSFETEANFEKFCLVNDAVYVAKFKDGKKAGQWTATGTQFAVPYVFKKLFSKEPIEFDDMCETKAVTSALYLKNNDPDAEITIIDPETGKEKTIKKGDTPEFVGRIGRFCPIKPGCGGKELLRECKDKDGNIKYSAATGTKGYLWLESEFVKSLGKEDDIDRINKIFRELMNRENSDIKYGEDEEIKYPITSIYEDPKAQDLENQEYGIYKIYFTKDGKKKDDEKNNEKIKEIIANIKAKINNKVKVLDKNNNNSTEKFSINLNLKNLQKIDIQKKLSF